MFNQLMQTVMEEKIALQDLFEVKKLVDQMDLLEFKAQWNSRFKDGATLEYTERLKYMIMSIKILQAKADLKRMIMSVKEQAIRDDPDKALYYYLRANLWKFLDNFRYVLLVDDIRDQDKLECIDLLEELSDIIAQDDDLKTSCLHRLHKIFDQVRILEDDASLRRYSERSKDVYRVLDERIAHVIHLLEPTAQRSALQSKVQVTSSIQKLIQTYSSFSISRISIEKSGVLSIIQLLHEHPLADLEAHLKQLQDAFAELEQQSAYHSAAKTVRNKCAYALLILLEIVKMHKGLPVLLFKIVSLCTYLHFPPSTTHLSKELRELKGKVTDITQRKLRPIIEDVLWKTPSYLTNFPHLRKICPWCYQRSKKATLNISYIRKVVTSSFDRLESTSNFQLNQEGLKKSHLSEMVIEILGLMVNIEPSPHFLKAHTRETQLFKKARESESSSGDSMESILEQQYTTYKNHLKFLHDSIEYYDGISEKMENMADEESEVTM